MSNDIKSLSLSSCRETYREGSLTFVEQIRVAAGAVDDSEGIKTCIGVAEKAVQGIVVPRTLRLSGIRSG